MTGKIHPASRYPLKITGIVHISYNALILPLLFVANKTIHLLSTVLATNQNDHKHHDIHTIL